METCGIALALASDSELLSLSGEECENIDLHLSTWNATGDRHCDLDKPGKGLWGLKLSWA